MSFTQANHGWQIKTFTNGNKVLTVSNKHLKALSNLATLIFKDRSMHHISQINLLKIRVFLFI